MDKFFLGIKYCVVIVFLLNSIGLFIAGQKNQGAVSFVFAIANYLIFFGK